MRGEKLEFFKRYLETADVREFIANEGLLLKAYARYLLGYIKTNEGCLKLLFGLYNFADLTDSLLYRRLAFGVGQELRERGLGKKHLQDYQDSVRTEGLLSLSVSESARLASQKKSLGIRVGFKHGFFRALTPGSLVGIIVAGEHCDELFLGMESGDRARRIKGVDPIFAAEISKLFEWLHTSSKSFWYGDFIRESSMILFPNLANQVVRIDTGYWYSNKEYREIVESLRPNVYFGFEGYPEWLRIEMKERADLVGADYIEIPQIHSWSTTDYFDNQQSRVLS